MVGRVSKVPGEGGLCTPVHREGPHTGREVRDVLTGARTVGWTRLADESTGCDGTGGEGRGRECLGTVVGRWAPGSKSDPV